LPYSATTAAASISTRNSGRASPETMAAVIAGGLGRVPQTFLNASKPGWGGWYHLRETNKYLAA